MKPAMRPVIIIIVAILLTANVTTAFARRSATATFSVTCIVIETESDKQKQARAEHIKSAIRQATELQHSAIDGSTRPLVWQDQISGVTMTTTIDNARQVTQTTEYP